MKPPFAEDLNSIIALLLWLFSYPSGTAVAITTFRDSRGRQLQPSNAVNDYCQFVQVQLEQGLYATDESEWICDCDSQQQNMDILLAACRIDTSLCFEDIQGSIFYGTPSVNALQGSNTFVYDECFEYEDEDLSTICYSDLGQGNNACEITINNETCQSCRVCNVDSYSLVVDCTNILPEYGIWDECEDNNAIEGTLLRFASASTLLCNATEYNPKCEDETESLVTANPNIRASLQGMFDHLDVLSFDDICTQLGLLLECFFDYADIETALTSECEKAGGLYYELQYEVRCSRIVPTYYYGGLRYPNCASMNCTSNDLVEQLRESLDDLIVDLESAGFGTCSLDVYWDNMTLKGPDLVTLQQVCTLVETNLQDGDIFLDTDMLCSCIQEEEDLDFLIKCHHEGLLCLDSASSSDKPFEGSLKYDLIFQPDFYEFLDWSTCFGYQGSFNDSTVCLHAFSNQSCAVTINGGYCQACSLCSSSDMWVQVDCSNIVEDAKVWNQCSGYSALSGTHLSFYGQDVYGKEQCHHNNGVTQAPTGTSAAPPRQESKPTEICMEAVNADPEICKPLVRAALAMEKCSCYNFCDGDFIGCTDLGSVARTSDMQCDGQLVAGCSIDTIEESNHIQDDMVDETPSSATGTVWIDRSTLFLLFVTVIIWFE